MTKTRAVVTDFSLGLPLPSHCATQLKTDGSVRRFAEQLLCTRHCSNCQRSSREGKRKKSLPSSNVLSSPSRTVGQGGPQRECGTGGGRNCTHSVQSDSGPAVLLGVKCLAPGLACGSYYISGSCYICILSFPLLRFIFLHGICYGLNVYILPKFVC